MVSHSDRLSCMRFCRRQYRAGHMRDAHRHIVLDAHLVVSAHRRNERDRRHILKAVDPLATLRALASDINHAAWHQRGVFGRIVLDRNVVSTISKLDSTMPVVATRDRKISCVRDKRGHVMADSMGDG